MGAWWQQKSFYNQIITTRRKSITSKFNSNIPYTTKQEIFVIGKTDNTMDNVQNTVGPTGLT